MNQLLFSPRFHLPIVLCYKIKLVHFSTLQYMEADVIQFDLHSLWHIELAMYWKLFEGPIRYWGCLTQHLKISNLKIPQKQPR